MKTCGVSVFGDLTVSGCLVLCRQLLVWSPCDQEVSVATAIDGSDLCRLPICRQVPLDSLTHARKGQAQVTR